MLEVHEFGGETLVNEVLFDQLGFLVDHFEQCESFGCLECNRYIAVRDKLMTPFAEVQYHGFAIAERRRRIPDLSQQTLAVGRSGKTVHEIPSRTQ
jgi:hypothetical protein